MNTTDTMNSSESATGKGYRLDFIKEAAKDYTMLIDTCSLLSRSYRLFFRRAMPYLKSYGKQVILAKSVTGELEKFARNAKPADKQAARAKVDEIQADLKHYQQQGIMLQCGDDNDSPVADAVFLKAVTTLRTKYNMMLITEDKKLTQEIERLGTSQAVRGIKKVRVCRISKEGYLVPPHTAKDSSSRSGSSSGRKSAPRSGSRSGASCTQAFAQGGHVRAGKGDLLPIHGEIGEGTTLNAAVACGSTRQVRLGKRLGGGGEGDVYETSDGTLVAKVYKPQCNTTHKRDKLQLLLDHQATCPGVCFPVALLYNKRQEFVGYLMPRAKGHELQRLFNRPVMQQHFPRWKKEDLVQLCLTIVEKVECLHRMNLILGDINANNILAESPTEVYFVDTDSYQVQDYPCPVGKDLFTAPEIMGRNYAEFLRTPEHENFSLAVLLFMVLMLGKHPYSRQDGGSPAENIRSGIFPYAAGELKGKNAPQGSWVYMWSHLSRAVKDAFYSVFQQGGEHYAPASRLTATDWKFLLRRYLAGLKNGMLETDSMSNDLYPTRRKISKDTPMGTCRKCGKSVPLAELRSGLCQDCQGKAHSATCKRCGNTFMAYPRANGEKPDWCPDCRHWATGTKMQATCCCCGKAFTITNAEYGFYTSRGLDMPKRCKNCRGSSRGSYTSSGNSGSYTPTSGSKGFFATILDFFMG